MSVEVTFEAIRKSDFVPFASFYLGGNQTVYAVKSISELEHKTISNGWVADLGNWKDAIDHLIKLEDSFYSGHCGNEAIELINQYQDQMAYFLRVG